MVEVELFRMSSYMQMYKTCYLCFFFRMAGCWVCGLLLLASSATLKAENIGGNSSADVMVVKYWAEGLSPGIRPYLTELIRQALIATEAEYGPYHLETNHPQLSTLRSMREMEKDGRLNLQFSNSWQDGAEEVELIIYPYTNGLLGLRKCLIRKNDLEFFETITTLDELKKIRVGQGVGWPDNDVYRSEHIELFEAKGYQALFPMLMHGRFECIPLSVLEIEGTLNEAQAEYPDMTIAPNFYIFYPMNLSLVVTKYRDDIVKRMRVGFKKVIDSKKHIKLLNSFYPNIAPDAAVGPVSVVFLQNPNLTPDENENQTQAMKEILRFY